MSTGGSVAEEGTKEKKRVASGLEKRDWALAVGEKGGVVVGGRKTREASRQRK